MKAVAFVSGALVALAGCATSSSNAPTGHVVELDDVPFFPQKRYQCGPAALATILVNSGVAVTPDELVPLVYVPDRKGSFQPELKAAARRYDRLPYELDPEPRALFAEIDAGNPVLVLQNLLFDWLPKWHYAVVVGYNTRNRTVILRSGTRERRVEGLRGFLRSWQRADYWAVIALRPGQIPATASAAGYVRLTAESEGRVTEAAMNKAVSVGLNEWSDNADINFAAANNARLLGDVIRAAGLYRRSLQLDPGHLGALNNYSDLLLTESCFAAARTQIETAQQIVDPESTIYPVIMATADDIESASETADTGESCPSLTADQ